MLAIAAAFAAPCLAYLGVAPFGIVFTGPSSTGKTMCTLAAASVVGLGDEMSLSTWHMTPSRYEELARRHGDLLLPIDDLSTIEGDDRARFKKAANFAHWLSHGGRRERLSSAGTEATSRPITGQGLRAIVVTSSETSLAELAHRGGRQKLDEGVKVRLIGVPAVAAGAAGVFDRLEGSSHDRHRAGELTDRIKLAARRHQGEVFVGWLRHLAATPSRKVEEKLKALLKAFVDRCRKISTEGTALRIAEKFGVIYAAGCMAIAAGFLPWSRKAFRQAVLACYRAAVVGPSEPAVAEQALNTLREHLADGTRIASRRPTEAKLKDGWREKRPDGTTVTYVVGKAFDRWFIEPERGQLLNTLIRQGVLKSGLGRARTLQRAPRGGDRVRVYPMAF